MNMLRFAYIVKHFSIYTISLPIKDYKSLDKPYKLLFDTISEPF